MGDYDWGFVLFVTLIFVVVLPAYFGPALIAYTRRHPRRGLIAGLNLILGGAIITVIFGPYWVVDIAWTVAFVVWILLLLWAFLPAGRTAEGKDTVPQLPAWRRRLSIIMGVLVLGVIGTVIAIPYLERSRHAVAPESSAVGSIRLLVNCAVSYQTGHPAVGFPRNAKGLGPVSGGGDGCIDQVLTEAASGGPPKTGYYFFFAGGSPNEAGVLTTFYVLGFPSKCGETGIRTYYADQTGVVRFLNDLENNCPIPTATSPPLS